MPAFFLDAVDDTPVFDGCTSFNGGMFSNARPNTLKPNQAALMVNCDVKTTGEAVTRRGTSQVGGGPVKTAGIPVYRLVRFSMAGGTGTEQLIAVSNTGLVNRLYYYNDGGAWTLLTSAFTPSSANPIVQGLDKIYVKGNTDLRFYSWDGATAVDLTTVGANPAPLGIVYHVWFQGRLAAVYNPGGAADTVIFSDILDETNWPVSTNSIRVGGGDGDPITGLSPWLDFNLIVIKQHSLWIVNCDPSVGDPNVFPIKPLHSKVGSLAPQTFVQVDSDVFGLTDSGVRSMQRTFAAEQQSELGDPISYPVGDIIRRINKAYFSTCVATYWNNRYILSVPLDSSTVPNYTLVYNTVTNTWMGYWTGWTPLCFATRFNPSDSSVRLVYGSNDGNVYEFLDYVADASEGSSTFKDNGTNIASQIITRAMIFDEPICKKTGLNAEVEYVSAGTLTAQLVADGTNAGSAVSLDSTKPRCSFDVQAIGQFRELQLSLSSTSGKQQIRNINASAFIDTVQLAS